MHEPLVLPGADAIRRIGPRTQWARGRGAFPRPPAVPRRLGPFGPVGDACVIRLPKTGAGRSGSHPRTGRAHPRGKAPLNFLVLLNRPPFGNPRPVSPSLPPPFPRPIHPRAIRPCPIRPAADPLPAIRRPRHRQHRPPIQPRPAAAVRVINRASPSTPSPSWSAWLAAVRRQPRVRRRSPAPRSPRRCPTAPASTAGIMRRMAKGTNVAMTRSAPPARTDEKPARGSTRARRARGHGAGGQAQRRHDDELGEDQGRQRLDQPPAPVRTAGQTSVARARGRNSTAT